MVADKYRVVGLLGAGGMGFVLAADNVALHQRVAMKFLAPEAARDMEAVQRFLREARASVRIRSEHVAQVFDVGTTKEGTPYLVMEMLEGEDLGSVLAQRGPLPPPIAAGYVIQACAGLASAHARGVVHRDLKPSNLFLTRRDDGAELVKIIDFGIAKAVETPPGGVAPAASITDTRAVMGSPAYMSPEQIRSSKNVDARTDIWSLGVVLYELLSAKVPFDGPTSAAVLAAVAADPPAPLPETVPADLRATVMRCLSKDPATRMTSAGALAMELAQHCPGGRDLAERAQRTEQGHGQSRPPPAAISSPPAVAGAASPDQGAAAVSMSRTVGRTVTGRTPARTAIAIAGTAVLVGGLGLGYAFLHAPARSTTSPSATAAGSPVPPSATPGPSADRSTSGASAAPRSSPDIAAASSASAPATASAPPAPAPAASAAKSAPRRTPSRRAPTADDDPTAASH